MRQRDRPARIPSTWLLSRGRVGSMLPEPGLRQSKGWWAVWRKKARELKVQTVALYFACRDPRVPWYAKALAGLVAAYALSPIDLIPDFIPILGYLDDLILVPLGIYLALRLISPEVMAECQAKAEVQLQAGKPQAKFMAVVIVAIWAALLLAVLLWAARRLGWI